MESAWLLPRSDLGNSGPKLTARTADELGLRRQSAIEPSVAGALAAGRAGLHVVLRIEMGAGRVRRANRFDNGKLTLVPKRLQGMERRVQAEETVEIDGGIGCAVGAGNGDGGARARSIRVRRAAPPRSDPSTAPRWKMAIRIFFRWLGASFASAARESHSGTDPMPYMASAAFLRNSRRVGICSPFAFPS